MKNPFSGLFRARDKPQDSVSAAPTFYFGTSGSGKPVNATTAIQLSTVYACVRVISETVASLPLGVYEAKEDGNRKATEHPLYRLIHDEPNSEMTSFVLREVMLAHLLLWGNSYCQIIRTGRNKITGLYPLLPDKMTVDRDKNGILTYTYMTNTGQTVVLSPEDVLHIPGLGFDGIMGYSPIALEKNAIGLGIASEEYGSKFFSNGARPSGILTHPNTVKNPKALRESWNAAYGGSSNANRVAILEEGMKFEPMAVPNNEAQFLETRKFQVDEICRIFRVPPHLVGDLEHATFSNIEHMSIDFAVHTIRPWLVRIEQAMNRALFTDQEKGRFYVQFNIDGLMRGDYKSRMEGYAIARQNGWMSANDIRALENQNPISAEEGGDAYLVNGTESEIMAMSLRLAGAGKQVGLSEAQILGFAAALSSVGIESQMGGSAFSKALIKMEVAAATGGEALEDFAKVSGMTASEFKSLWERDAASAFQAFIVGLSKMDEQGVSAIKTLDDIGIAEIRLRDTLLRATNATELFSKTQDTANKAWAQNTALTTEANKRYATTKSRLINLKNTALMFARQIGDDLNPTIQQIIDKAGELLQKFLSLDATQRQSIVKWAAFAAAVGPVVLVLGKVVGAVGTVTGAMGKAFTAIGKFSAKVSMAGGGLGGFIKTLASSKLAMAALAAALVYGAIKLVDYASGAKAAREALEGMAKTAKSWKETEAETFYGKSQGLSFFGMTKDDFTRAVGNSKEWMNGLLAVWSDGKKETNEIVTEWTDSFKSLTASTRDELNSLKQTADQAGYASVSAQLQADIDTLDAMDAEIAKLLKKRQNKNLTEKDKIRLQELIDTREAIEVKYHLTAADTDGFDTIRNKVEAEVARAEARGQEVSATVYENAMVAAAEGMSAVNSSLDAQYDKEYALIQLIENSTERQQAMDALNAKYNNDRRAAAMEYAQLMADVVMPVWQQDDIQTAKTQVGDLMQLLRQYSAATTDAEKKSFLPELNKLTASMDEGALTEYVGLLTQIQSLLDSGMSESEVQAMFPEIDFSSALEQLAAIQTYLNDNKWDTNLTSLNEMFGEAVGEEVLKIATDLDMTGAMARWQEWASNPGAITTDAVIQGYTEAENATKQQPLVDAFVAKYTEQPEGADKSQLTPAGLVAYVQTYAEATTGADVSGLNPTNVTAMVSAYKELASGTDVTQLTPSQITAYVFKYLEENKIDTTGLTPEGVTAFVMAYEEITGGASTAALKPSDVVGLITKYAEAENVDVSSLSSAQVEGIVTKFAEATGCDKSELMREFTAYITEYKEAAGVKKPTLNLQVGLSGYDLLAYRRWLKNNKVEVEGIVRLSEAYEDPSSVLGEAGVKYWKDGQEIPVTAVTSDMLKPDDVAILDKDGTMHILITTEVTGASEAIAEMREQVAEVDQLGMTALGTALTGIMPASLMDYIKAAEKRIADAKGSLDQWWNFIYGGNEGIMRTLDQSMQYDFDAENVAQLATYVAEVTKAIQNGEAVSQEDMDNLKAILQFVQDLDSVGVGENVTAGIAEGMTEAGWDTSAETLATNLETAINSALIINSPSERMKPSGEYVAAGVGAGMGEYDFSTDAAAMATSLESAISAALTAESLTPSGTGAMAGLAGALTAYDMSGAGTTVSANVKNAVSRSLTATSLKSIGTNAMAGLKAGITAGRSGVVSAMQSAARAAVNAAKKELKIASPSRVFRDEIGSMTMKGFGEGVLQESRVQARTIRNAARFLTGEAKEGAIAFGNNDNRKTYNQTSSINLSGNNFYVRDEQDIRSLAIEIATLTKRQQRGRGLRMA